MFRKPVWDSGLALMIAVLVVGGVLLGGCGDPGLAVKPTADTQPKAGSAIRSDLLAIDEIRKIQAFGYDVREQPVLDKTFSLTTLRGPCGTSVPAPFASDKGYKVFKSTITLVVEAIADPGVDPATDFVYSLQADLRSGCAPFTEQIGSEGPPSKVAFVEELDLSAAGAQRVAWEQTVTAADATVQNRYTAAVRGGGRVMLVVVLSNERFDKSALATLVDQATGFSA
jgi:hypothetical protein